MSAPDSERIRKARESLRWPRSAVATLLRVQPYAIFAYERGDRSVPAGMAEWLEALAAAMKRALRAHPPPPSPRERQFPRKTTEAHAASSAPTESSEERIEDSASDEAHCDTAALGSARLG